MILDTLIYLAAINASCALFDGAAFLESRTYPDKWYGTITVAETGPAAILTGPYPTFESFLVAGIAEVMVLSAVSYGLKRCGLKKYWWIPQLSISVYHAYLGEENIRIHKNAMRYGREHGLY